MRYRPRTCFIQPGTLLNERQRYVQREYRKARPISVRSHSVRFVRSPLDKFGRREANHSDECGPEPLHSFQPPTYHNNLLERLRGQSGLAVACDIARYQQVLLSLLFDTACVYRPKTAGLCVGLQASTAMSCQPGTFQGSSCSRDTLLLGRRPSLDRDDIAGWD